MRFSNINDLVEGLMKDVEHEKKAKKTLSTKEKALRKALTESKNAIDRNNHRGGKKLADYRRSFEELLESYYPGRPWYQITSVNIDNEFANGTTPEQLITKLVENIRPAKTTSNTKSKTHTKLNESKSLKEGSLISKAKQALQDLRSRVGEDGMYEELDYDDFELEEAYSEIDDDIDEGCNCKEGLLKEGSLTQKAISAIHKLRGGSGSRRGGRGEFEEDLNESEQPDNVQRVRGIGQKALDLMKQDFQDKKAVKEGLPDGCKGKGCRCKGTLNGPTDDEIGLNEGNETGTPLSVIGKKVANNLRGGRNEELPDGCTGTPLSVIGKKVANNLRGGMKEDLPDGCKGKGCGCKGTLNGPTDEETGLDEGCGKKGKKRPIKEAAGDEGGSITVEWTDNGSCRDRGCFDTPNSKETTTIDYTDITDLINQLGDLGISIYCGEGPGATCLDDIFNCLDDMDITGGDPVVFTITDDTGNVIYDSGYDKSEWYGDDEEWDDEEWDDDYIPDDDGYVPDEEGYMPEGLADTGKKALKKIKGITGGR